MKQLELAGVLMNVENMEMNTTISRILTPLGNNPGREAASRRKPVLTPLIPILHHTGLAIQ